MSVTLTIALSGSRLVMRRQRTRPGIRALFGRRTAASAAAADAPFAAALSGVPLEGVIEEGLRHLDCASATDRLQARVQLGFAFSTLGILKVDRASSLPFDRQRTLITGWVEQRLHLSGDTQVLRWQTLRSGTGFLVSCVDRSCLETLEAFCRSRRIRLASCVPAVVGAIRAARICDGVVAWSEGSGDVRDGTVQLLQFEAAAPVAAWRGWVPPHAGSGEADTELRNAGNRFLAHIGRATSDPVEYVRWPADSAWTR